MGFKNIYNINREDRLISKSGEKTRPDYKPTYGNDGKYRLEVCGEINSYDDIQSYHDTCDLQQIIAKYNMTGNADLLNKRHGFYMDISEFPETYAEMQNAMIQAEMEFNSMPLEFKKKFNNNVREFFVEMGTEGFYEKINPIIEDKDVLIKVDDKDVKDVVIKVGDTDVKE